MTIIEILNTYKKQKHNTYRECDVIHAMNKYAEYREARFIQLMQTAVVGRSEQLCDCKNIDPEINGWVRCKDCGEVFMV